MTTRPRTRARESEDRATRDCRPRGSLDRSPPRWNEMRIRSRMRPTRRPGCSEGVVEASSLLALWTIQFYIFPDEVEVSFSGRLQFLEDVRSRVGIEHLEIVLARQGLKLLNGFGALLGSRTRLDSPDSPRAEPVLVGSLLAVALLVPDLRALIRGRDGLLRPGPVRSKRQAGGLGAVFHRRHVGARIRRMLGFGLS